MVFFHRACSSLFLFLSTVLFSLLLLFFLTIIFLFLLCAFVLRYCRLCLFFFFCSWRARVASIYVHTQPSAVFQVISIVITKSRAKLGKVLLSPFLFFFFFSVLGTCRFLLFPLLFVFVAIWLDVCLLCEVYISFLAALTFGLCLTRSKAAFFPPPSFQFLFFLNIRVTATKKTAFLDFYRTRIDAI